MQFVPLHDQTNSRTSDVMLIWSLIRLVVIYIAMGLLSTFSTKIILHLYLMKAPRLFVGDSRLDKGRFCWSRAPSMPTIPEPQRVLKGQHNSGVSDLEKPFRRPFNLKLPGLIACTSQALHILAFLGIETGRIGHFYHTPWVSLRCGLEWGFQWWNSWSWSRPWFKIVLAWTPRAWKGLEGLDAEMPRNWALGRLIYISYSQISFKYKFSLVYFHHIGR